MPPETPAPQLNDIPELEARLVQAMEHHQEMSTQLESLVQQNEDLKAMTVEGFASVVAALQELQSALLEAMKAPSDGFGEEEPVEEAPELVPED